MTLPIDQALPALRRALHERNCAVLEAPPGAGKTTRVPLALLDEIWLGQKRMVMLEPRRLAARAAAAFMARSIGEQVGEQIGYRIRGDTRVSPRTRVEVVTEGVLARLISADAALEHYGLVIFDEFHERSLHGDLALALTLETQHQLRPELRVLVMSATLDGDQVARLIGGDEAAPVVRSVGRAFPVITHYRPPRAGDRPEAAVARTVREAVAAEEGDVLVFLPGAAEQRRVAALLHGDDGLKAASATVHTLHGTMPIEAQDAALAPAPAGTRKVVLSTSVAETSLTIEGVRVVVDGGLSRVPRYDARVGMTRLLTVRVSRASADQRRGRAGRTAPGVCYRLWDAHEESGLQASTRAEILDADLAPLALELADAGVRDPAMLRWLDLPGVGTYSAACEVLLQLGAIDPGRRITAHGRRMAKLPIAPRIAHMLLIVADRSPRLGAEIAALLGERDILRSTTGTFRDVPADLQLRVDALRERSTVVGVTVDRDLANRVRQSASELERRVRARDASARDDSSKRNDSATQRDDDAADTGAVLALAFPDRVARRREGQPGRFLLRNGTGASIERGDALANSEWLAIAELDGNAPEYRIARAAALTRDDVTRDFERDITRSVVVEWHESTRAVRATRRTSLGAITIEETVVGNAEPALLRHRLLEQIALDGIDALPWSEGASALRARMAFLHYHDASWPDVGSESLAQQLDEWLGPRVDGMRKWTDLSAVDWHDALLSLLPWERRASLDRIAPASIEVPSGSRIRLDYADPASPMLAVKLQEVFGWTATPLVLDGQVPVTMSLLSPAGRPVQVTRDLAGFWRSSYFDVRRELRGRYPRHPWPDDPLSAPPTRRAKPRGT